MREGTERPQDWSDPLEVVISTGTARRFPVRQGLAAGPVSSGLLLPTLVCPIKQFAGFLG